MFKCHVAHHGEMEVVGAFTGTHVTGEEKYYRVRYCPRCNTHYFFVSMEATVSYGTNYFAFRIELTEAEAKEMLAVLADKSDAARVEKYLNDFDRSSIDRRVILEDEQERWVSSE